MTSVNAFVSYPAYSMSDRQTWQTDRQQRSHNSVLAE